MATPLSQPILDGAAFATIALLGRPAVMAASGLLLRRFFPDRYQQRQAMRRLGALLGEYEGLPGEEEALVALLAEALGFERAGLYGREPGRDRLRWMTGTHPTSREAIALSDVEGGTALIEGYASGMLLSGHQHIIGYLVLGERTSGRAFTRSQQRLLMQASQQLLLSLENRWLGRAVIDEQVAASRADEDRVVQERVNAVVSHQLKTPLLLGQSMLADARNAITDRARVAKRLDKIALALARFEKNVIQNHDRQRIAAGGYVLEVSPTPLVPLIGRCLDEVRYSLGKRDARALLEVPADSQVLANPERLEIILDNLIGNAMKVLPPGGTLAIRAERVGDRLRIDVSDDGPGIPPARLERLFSVQTPNPEDPTSTGFGLAICRDYMVGMGGSIELHENGPGGATFRLELKAVESRIYPPSPPC